MGEIVVKPIHNSFKQYRKVNLVNPYLFSKPFESVWRTGNISTGSSTSTQVKLPLVSTGVYNFTVDWGDGTSNSINAWNQAQTLHTYAVSGDYTIRITGICTGWQFNNTGDRLKMLSVANWGKFNPGNVVAHFYGCSNLTLTNVGDVLDLTGCTTFVNSFRSCTSLTTVGRMNEWNVSSINTLASTFAGSTNFNQNISNWNVSNVTDLSGTFSSTAFNQPIGSWNTSNVNTMSGTFNSSTAFNQNIGAWNVSNVTTFFLMFNFCATFNNGGSNTINNWVIKNTGTVSFGNMFAAASTFNQPIGNWNTVAVTTMNDMFSSATAFNQNIGSWNTTNVTSFASMFSNASNFNQNIGAWNVTKVTSFVSMFNNALVFNNGGSNTINNWVLNTTSSISMQSMFNNARAFNQPIGNWNTIRVTTMQSTFQSAVAFNQNIGAWNTSNVTSFVSMFNTAGVFNNGGSNTINNWVTSSATTMQFMFALAQTFNQNVGSWNTSAVSNMQGVFQDATNFDNASTALAWNTGNATSMSGMFRGTKFNQNIGAWNVSNVADFSLMFNGCTLFNNGGSNTINTWTIKTTGTVNMSGMFGSTTVFNQPLGSWNVSAVTNMSSMFNGFTAFNQDIGAWNVSNVTNFTNFMASKQAATFTTANLDSIYNGWSSRPAKPSIVITFGACKYTAASSAGRAILTGSPNNWAITDGGI